LLTSDLNIATSSLYPVILWVRRFNNFRCNRVQKPQRFL
jgi:hypothetical protein